MSRGRLAKFTSEDVLCISKRLAAGEPIKALAEEYGVSKGPIYDIKNGKHPLQKRVPFIPEQRKPLDTEIHAETDGHAGTGYLAELEELRNASPPRDT
jgi:hypothetical protein